jgi:caffeoyl-CoA O-methyltransferase
MRRGVLCVLAIGAAVLAGQRVLVYSEEPAAKPAVSAEERAKFLKEFHRTGLATTADDAMFLRIMVAARGAKRGIEVGTERGYGAINMGIAFERNGGQLFTLEIDPKVAQEARDNAAKMGLGKTVTVITGDALKELPKLEGEFDFLFIDALKSDYLKYLQAVEAKLKPGAVIIADNAIQSARAMKDFLDYVKASPNYETVVIKASQEKSDGMSVSYKIR